MKARVLWRELRRRCRGMLWRTASRSRSRRSDCSAVTEDMARLKCYDEQAARQKKQSSAPSGGHTSSKRRRSAAAAPPLQLRRQPITAPLLSPARRHHPAERQPPQLWPPRAPASGASDFGLDAEAIRKQQAAANPGAPQGTRPGRRSRQSRGDQGARRIPHHPRRRAGLGRDPALLHHTARQSVGETVTIKRGLLGSYFLSHSAGLALRVKRIH